MKPEELVKDIVVNWWNDTISTLIAIVVIVVLALICYLAFRFANK